MLYYLHMNSKIIITTALVGIVVLIVVISYSFSSYQSALSPIPDQMPVQEFHQTPPLDLEGYMLPSGPPPSDGEWEEEETNSTGTDSANIQESLRQIFAEIEKNTQLGATNVSQCKALPLGHSPCGGPSFFHIYSESGSNISRLNELSQQHQALARRMNEENQLDGICVITEPPTITLVDGKCVKKCNKIYDCR
jgi:hypothetical protein